MLKEDWKEILLNASIEAGMNMKQVSLKAGKGETYFRDILKRNMVPSIDNLMRLVYAIGIDVNDLMENPSSDEPVSLNLRKGTKMLSDMSEKDRKKAVRMLEALVDEDVDFS